MLHEKDNACLIWVLRQLTEELEVSTGSRLTVTQTISFQKLVICICSKNVIYHKLVHFSLQH